MIKKKIKTIFNGQAGIHEKYITQALESGDDILLIHKGEYMEIKNNQIGKLGVWGKHTFLDRFKKEFYHLVYFDWNPQSTQTKLC